MQGPDRTDASPVRPPAAPALAAPSLLTRLRDRDHTQGSLLTSLLVMSLPSILTSFAGMGIFQLVELRFLSSLGSTSMAVVGMTNQSVRQVAFLLVIGLSTGTQMMIARLVGMGRADGADHVAGQTLVTGALMSVAFAAIGLLFPREMLSVVTSDPVALEQGVPYVRLVFVLMFGQVFGPCFSSILSGAGDTTTPMMITLASTPVVIFAEWCLIFGHLGLPEMGILGVAVGAAIGSFVSLAISLWVLFTGRARVHLRLRHMLPDFGAIRRLVSVSWQPAMHMVARSLMVMYFMWLAGRLGTDVQAAYTIGLRIEMVPIMVAFPIANACATLVGQNLGAESTDRAWHSIRVAMAVEVGALWMFSLTLFLFRHDIAGFFSGDPNVAAMAAEYILFAAIGQTFYGVYFVAFRSLQGAGDMTSPMLISVATAALVGAPLGYYLATQTDLGPTGMWVANLGYQGLNTTFMVGWLATGRWARQGALLSRGFRPQMG